MITLENSIIVLGSVGEWEWSRFSFDTENNCFIEEKFEEEYLDTGTKFKGSHIVTAKYIYDAFTKHKNALGITNLLKYVDRSQLE